MAQYLKELTRSNEDLRQFANVIAHDLRAPLRTVAGFVENLGARLMELGVTDPEAEDSIKRIAFLKGLGPDPSQKKQEKSAEEELAEVIRAQAEQKQQGARS